MPRRPRRGTAGLIFHVMNRAARRMALFDQSADYAAFIEVLRDASHRIPLRLLSYVVMPNHWHLVVWPRTDDELTTFMAWMTVTHSRRWHRDHGSSGTGTIYQGRYRAIAVKGDRHLLTLCRYVERNPVRARLVTRAEEWPWSSAAGSTPPARPALEPWPVSRPINWQTFVNTEDAGRDLRRLREAVERGVPFGTTRWARKVARDLGWPAGQNPPGRPQQGRGQR